MQIGAVPAPNTGGELIEVTIASGLVMVKALIPTANIDNACSILQNAKAAAQKPESRIILTGPGTKVPPTNGGAS